jgi:hypothetical protein
MYVAAGSPHTRRLFAIALAALGVIVSGTRYFAQEPETDDATARRIATYQWYNDTVPDRSPGRGHHSRPFTPGYQRFLNDAAARERARYGSQLPSADSPATVGSAKPSPGGGGPAWANLGPTHADFLKNGSFTLAKTDAGRIRTIIADPINPSLIYVATAAGGVWRSTDTGGSWTSLTEGLGTLSIGSLALDPGNSQVLYLGLGDPFDGTGIGFVKSTDGGNTWSAPVYLGDSTTINQVLALPTTPTTVLATTDKGLYRSTDAGATWSLAAIATGQAGAAHAWSIDRGTASRLVVSLEALPDATSGTTDGQVWISNDNGVSWLRAAGITGGRKGVGRITVAAAPSNRQIMYAMAALPNATTTSDLLDIFRSSDGGATWTGVGARTYTNGNRESRSLGTLMSGQGWYDQLVMVHPQDPNHAYFGGALLLAETTDGGGSFSQRTNWLAQFGLPYVHADFHAGFFDATGTTMYVGTDGGVFKSTDGGATWSDSLNNGIITHLLYNIGSSPNDVNAVTGGMQDNGTRLRSGGTTTFNQVIGGDGFGTDVHGLNAQLMLGSVYYTQIRKSTDGGSTFASACTGIAECGNGSSAPFFTRIVPVPSDATKNTVLTSSNTKIYRSTNYATNWSALGTSGLPSDLLIRNFGVSATNANLLGIAGTAGRVALSTDGGTTWTLVPMTALPDNGLSMSSVAFDPAVPTTIFVSSVAPDATKAHAWRSTTNGASWTRIDGGGFPTGVPVNQLVKVGASLYAGTHLGVYVSADDGLTWARWGTGMPLVNVTDLNFANPSLVRAASYGRGFWEIVP